MPFYDEIHLNKYHFDRLAFIRGVGCNWTAGRVPKDWGESVDLANVIIEQLPTKKMDRTELLDYCQDAQVDVSVATILAWGGMKVSHGKRVSSPAVWERLIPIAKELKLGKICRRCAYKILARFRAQNPGCGLGPAYFTKLIYFLDPKHNGYIMDQWTSLSVNLLFSRSERSIVCLTTNIYRGRRTDTVSDKNLPGDYDCFCLCIEELAKSLQTEDPSQAEEWIFSKGGRQPAPWRKYVLANRPIKK